MGVSSTGRNEAAATSAKTTIATDRSEPGRAVAVSACQAEETISSDRWIGAYAVPATAHRLGPHHAIGLSPVKSNPVSTVFARHRLRSISALRCFLIGCGTRRRVNPVLTGRRRLGA